MNKGSDCGQCAIKYIEFDSAYGQCGIKYIEFDSAGVDFEDLNDVQINSLRRR